MCVCGGWRAHSCNTLANGIPNQAHLARKHPRKYTHFGTESGARLIRTPFSLLCNFRNVFNGVRGHFGTRVTVCVLPTPHPCRISLRVSSHFPWFSLVADSAASHAKLFREVSRNVCILLRRGHCIALQHRSSSSHTPATANTTILYVYCIICGIYIYMRYLVRAGVDKLQNIALAILNVA